MSASSPDAGAGQVGTHHALTQSTLFAIAGVAIFVAVLVARILWLPDLWVLYVSDIVYVAVLAAAFMALWQVSRAVGTGDVSAVAWQLLMGASGAYLAAQVILTALRIQSGDGSIPFPSIADAIFVSGQLLIIGGLSLHVIAYVRTGLPVGSWASIATIYTIVVAIMVSILFGVLIPLWGDAAKPVSWKSVISLYTVLDLLMLSIAAAVLRIALVFGRGAIAHGWWAIAVGFASMTAGDALYAMGLDAFVPFAFLWAYGAVAYGAFRHREVITGI